MGRAFVQPASSSCNRISLTMIVKNEVANLEACLAGVRDLVHEMIVVDTGSIDGTRELATRLGAKVFDFAWVDDFAAARNEALRHATGEWIFWLDADDRLDEENRSRLRKLFASLKDENVAYHMTCKSIDRGGATLTDHVRLFRNRPEIRWVQRIHEQILPAVRKSGGTLRQTDLVIHHTGYQDPTVHRRKLERNLKLLERALQEHPNDVSVLYHLGVNYTALGRPADGLPVLQRALKAAGDADAFVRNLYGQIARAHHQLGHRAEALAVCAQGTARFPDDAELLFVESTLLTETGNLPAAEKRLLKLIDTTSRFVSGDAGLTGYKTRQNLAMIYRKQNRLAEAETQLRRVVQEQPTFALGRLALVDLCLAQSRWEEVEPLLAPIQSDTATAIDVALMVARSHLGRRDFAAARERLESVKVSFPADLRVLTLLTQVLLEQGTDREAAEKSLRAILAIDPEHAGARRTLASFSSPVINA